MISAPVSAPPPAAFRTRESSLGRADLALGLLALALLLVPILEYAYLGTFSRYIADDFCTAGTVRKLGFWDSQAWWYRSWSGRYSFTLVATLAHLLGPNVARWLPALATLTWFSALVRLLRSIPVSWPGNWAWAGPVILAALTLSLTFGGAPNTFQSLHWLTGILTYSLPLILGTLLLTELIRHLRAEELPKRGEAITLAASALAAFFIGGFSETYVSLQTGALAAALVFCWFLGPGKDRARATSVLVASLLGSTLALITIAVAPGNAVRQSLHPAPPDLWLLVQRVAADVHIFLYQVAKYQTLRVVLALLLPAAVAFLVSANHPSHTPRGRLAWARFLLGIPLFTAILVSIPFAPSEYALSSYPDGRVLIMPLYALVLGMVVWAAAVGSVAQSLLPGRRNKSLLAARCLLICAIALLAREAYQTTERLLDQAPAYAEFASAWDARDEVLREWAQRPTETAMVPSLRHMGGLAEIGYDPAEWINVCVAEAYDVAAVVAK